MTERDAIGVVAAMPARSYILRINSEESRPIRTIEPRLRFCACDTPFSVVDTCGPIRCRYCGCVMEGERR